MLIRSGGNVMEVSYNRRPENRKNKLNEQSPLSRDYPNKRRTVNATFSSPAFPFTSQSFPSPSVPLVQGMTERGTTQPIFTQISNVNSNTARNFGKLELFDDFDTSRKIASIQKLCELPLGSQFVFHFLMSRNLWTNLVGNNNVH